MSSPAGELSYIICIFRYAYLIITPPIHIAIGYFHWYFWLIYIWMDNQSECPVFSSLMERCVNIIGLVPLTVDLGIVNISNTKDVTGFSALSRESMRLLGRSDVLRFRQAVYAGIALIPGLFDLDRINGIKGVVCPLDATGPGNATGQDLTPIPIDVLPIDITQPSRGWVFSTRTYIAMAGLFTVPLVVYMFYVLIKQYILNSRLCKQSPTDKDMQLGLLDGEMIDTKDWASVDEDGPEPADNAVLANEKPLSDDAVDEAGSNFVVKSANFMFFKLSALPAWLPTMSLPFSVPFISPTTEALLKMSEMADFALQKSADCIVDALAPFVFGTLLMLTTATGILLYGVGHVGIAKIAESGIFGLNEDAIDTLLEMIHMQWRLMRQLKWSWWLSVAGRYESRCQYGSRQEQLGEGTGIAVDSEPEPEPERAPGHGVCTDAACPFQQVITHSVPQAVVLPADGAQPSSATDGKDVSTKAKSDVTDANPTNATATAPHRKSLRHRLGRHHGNAPDNHIKLDTRRDWLRWLVRGKDGKGSHYRDRHQRHNVNNALAKDVKDKSPKKIKASKSSSKAAEAVAE